MQHVPALDVERIAAQQFVARRAPDIGRHVELFGQDLLRAQGFAEDRPAAENMRLVRFAFIGGFEFVQSFENAFFDAVRHRRHRVVLVVEGEVVEILFAFAIHAAQAVAIMTAIS